MNNKLNKKPKTVLACTINLCWLKQKQAKARKRLLKAIQVCQHEQELDRMLYFAAFLGDEVEVQAAYHRRMEALEQQLIA